MMVLLRCFVTNLQVAQLGESELAVGEVTGLTQLAWGV